MINYDQPMAAKGLISYRYPSRYGGYIMIGARNDADALNEANRSLDRPTAVMESLEVWNGTAYVPVGETK